MPLLLWSFVKNYILEWKVDMHDYFIQRSKCRAVRHIFNIQIPQTSKSFKLVLKFCTTLIFTLGLPQNSIFCLYHVYLCLYEMKHRDDIWEPLCKQNKISMNIIYLPKRGVVCETAVFTECNYIRQIFKNQQK